MERWKGKIAVVTGASSEGIGKAIVKDLAKNGIIVIGLARRPEKIEEYSKTFDKSGEIHALKCDITDAESIKLTFKLIEEKFGVIHILVNNAGIQKNIKILGDDEISEKVEQTIDTNFTGLVNCSHEAYRLIKKSNDYGMIININSNAGHRIFYPSTDMSHNVYPGTKFAVTATSEILRQELIMQNNDKVRVTSISPGVTSTDFFDAAGFTPGTHFYGTVPAIKAEDVANAVTYLLTTPYYVNITELTLKHLNEFFNLIKLCYSQ